MKSYLLAFLENKEVVLQYG